MQPNSLYQTVEYINPFADEIGVNYTVVEIDVNSNWCIIQANVDMNIKPTYIANISELKTI